jgi:hypothetical protein
MRGKACARFQGNSLGRKGIFWATANEAATPNPNATAKAENVQGKCRISQRRVRARKVPLAPIPRRAKLMIRKAKW